jgi:opacity protein-like surface antigen
MKRFLLTAATLALLMTTAQACEDAPTMFHIPKDVSQGHMNVRNGPGSNHAAGWDHSGRIIRHIGNLR